jgi:hypothetical protein
MKPGFASTSCSLELLQLRDTKKEIACGLLCLIGEFVSSCDLNFNDRNATSPQATWVYTTTGARANVAEVVLWE